MAGERTLPGLSLTGYWDAGDNTWKPGMDENLRKLSVLVQLRVLSMTTPLPADDSNSSGVANGDIYLMPVSDSNSIQDSNSSPAHGAIAVFDNGAWVYYTPLVGFIAYVIDQNQHYRYTSGGWVQMGGTASAITYDSGDPGDSNSTDTTVEQALNSLFARTNVVRQATGVLYDSGDTGDSNSTMTTVAAALDDLYERVRNVSAGIVDASTVLYNSGDTGDSNSTATTVQEALDDIYDKLRDVTASSGDITFVPITAGLTLTAADNKSFYLVSDSSNSPATVDIGIPEDGLEDLVDGFTVSACQLNDSQVAFVGIEDSNSPGAVVLLYPADMLPRTRGINSVITAVKTNVADTWLVFGDLEPA